MNFGQLHPTLRLRIGVGFVQRFLNVMVMPLMTIFLADRFGLGMAGLLMVGAVALEVVGTLVGGHLADLYGRRRLLLVGEFGVAAAFIVMAAAAMPWWSSPIAVYAGFTLSNLAASMALPANDAMIVDLTNSASRTFVYTVNYWAINLALACGAVLGGFLYTDYFGQLLAGAAIGSIVVFMVTLLFVAETARTLRPAAARQAGLREFLTGYRSVLRDGLFGALLVAATLRMALEVQINYYVAVRIVDTFEPQPLFSLGEWEPVVNGPEMLGLLRAENTLLVVLFAFLVHRLLARVDEGSRLYAGVALFTVGYMVLAVAEKPYLLALCVLVLTVGELLNVPVQQKIMADLVPEESRTRYVAVFNLNIRLGLVIASLIMALGSKLSPWGVAALYALMGALIAVHYGLVLRGLGRRTATPVHAAT